MSESSDDSESDEEPLGVVQCIICHDFLTVPKLLPCGHLLCRHCLVAWLRAEPETVCPHAGCHCAIADVKKDESGLAGNGAEEIADGLPTDLTMEVLVEAQKVLSNPHLCCVCNAADDDDSDGHLHQSEARSHVVVDDSSNAPLGPARRKDSATGTETSSPGTPPETEHRVGQHPATLANGGRSPVKETDTLPDKPAGPPSVTSPPALPPKVGSVGAGGAATRGQGGSRDTSPARRDASSISATFAETKTPPAVLKGAVTGKTSSAPPRPEAAVPAVGFCLDCGDAFCGACATVHRKQSATRRHAVRDLASLTMEDLAAASALRSDLCQLHSGQVRSLHCQNHNVAICVTCRTSVQHSKCQEVTSLERNSEQACADLDQAASTLQQAGEEQQRGLEQLDKHRTDTDQRTQAAEAEIEKACDALQTSVEACRRRLKNLVRSARSDVRTAVARRRSYFLQRQQLVACYVAAVERAACLSKHPSCQPMAATLKARVIDLDLSVASPTDARVMSAVTLTIDPQAVTRIQGDLAKLGRIKMEADLRFHGNHGKNVVLSNDDHTVQKTSIHRNHGIVMSRDPMFTNMLYEVRIDKIQPEYMLTRLGVVADCPHTFSELPKTFFCSDPDVLCLDHDSAYVFGQKKSVSWPALKDLAAGSRVGLAMDSDRGLHLYVNGLDKGLVARDMPDTLFFMFDLFARCTKVTALPVNFDI